MTEVLDKEAFEREWRARQAAAAEQSQVVVAPADKPFLRFVFRGFLEALVSFDDVVGQAPPAEEFLPQQSLGRINTPANRLIAAPKTIRRRALRQG